MCLVNCTSCVSDLYFVEALKTCVKNECPKSTTQSGNEKVCTKSKTLWGKFV